MTSIRWQRFTSDNGVTRQFPAVFDDSGRDQRLEPWYCLTTQVAMRVMLVLDMSDSMRLGGAMNIAKLAIFTILSTLKPHDSVNVLLIAGSTPGLPSFCPSGRVGGASLSDGQADCFPCLVGSPWTPQRR
jgi:hypothetical protein